MQYLPTVAFTALPTAILAVAYIWPRTRGVCIWLGLITFCLYFLFLCWKRLSQLSAVAAVLPTVFGPKAANLWVEHQIWSDQRAQSLPRLDNILSSGGDLLVELAFFFASLIGMILYLTQRIVSKERKLEDLIYWVPLVVIVGAMLMLNRDFVFTVWMKGGGHFPDITPFFASRVLLVLQAVALSTLPMKQDQTGSGT